MSETDTYDFHTDPRVPRKVFQDELTEVEARWEAVYGEKRKPEDGLGADEPGASAKRRMVGLGFSGGGIRSATINTGIAQSLYRHGVFDHVDYVSTVSGGGYLGSSLSTLMRRKDVEFPFKLDPPYDDHEEAPHRTESRYLTWVRNHSNYLATRGFLDYVRMVAVMVRGVLVNFLTLLPFLLATALLLAAVYGPDLVKAERAEQAATQARQVADDAAARAHNSREEGASNAADLTAEEERTAEAAEAAEDLAGPPASFRLARWVAIVVLVYYLLFPVVIRLFKVISQRKTISEGSSSSVKLRDVYERTFSGALLVLAGFLVIDFLPILIHVFHRFHDETVLRNWVTVLASGSSLAAVVGAGQAIKALGGAIKKLMMTMMVGMLGLLLPLVVVLHVAEILIYDNQRFSLDQQAFGDWTLGVVPIVLGIGIVAAFVAGLVSVGFKRSRWMLGLLVALAAVVGGLHFAQDALSHKGGGVQAWLFVFTVAVEIWLFCWLAVDVNLTSLNGFYRDRLASAYLVGVDTGGQIDIEEDVNLHQMREPGSRAPYHLVNVALNLQGSKDASIRERNSDFFIFSKKWVGGNRTGYCRSEDLEAVFPQMDLATAMAISAAAAAPNMGRGTSASMVAVMTLFNVRLGYWIPNPKRLAEWAKEKSGQIESTLATRFKWRIPPGAFLKEMTSKLDENGKWVNLSDGGHIENLATIELLRRRCKYIITGDGEADPNMVFNGLSTLVRYARIDLGIDIDIDLDDLRLGDDRLSARHWAIGRIRYPEGDEGYLLYLKSSYTDDEDEVVTNYRAKNPAFPHESTADQFFDEGQFEAYRALGQHIADGLFGGSDHAKETKMSFEELEAWFGKLAATPPVRKTPEAAA